ncbi:MAG TPA: stage II sporulation protein M [archaeon]|nr:stage II sporulation protein M [archaeon]
MVLESFIRIPEDSPLYRVKLLLPRVFFLSVISTFVGMALSFTLFPNYSSILWIAFVTVAAMPFMVDLFREQEEEAELEDTVSFFERNGKVVLVFVVFFFGVVIASSVAFAFGSLFFSQNVIDSLFSEQSTTLAGIRGLSSSITGKQYATGLALKPCESFGSCALFIFQNNIWVLVLIFVASFVYGAGAVFEISWNASIIGTFIGFNVRNLLAAGSTSKLGAYGTSLYYSLGFLPHGLMEIIGFSLAAMSGSILSAGLMRGLHSVGNRKTVIVDCVALLVFGVLSIALGALIEAGALFPY